MSTRPIQLDEKLFRKFLKDMKSMRFWSDENIGKLFGMSKQLIRYHRQQALEKQTGAVKPL